GTTILIVDDDADGRGGMTGFLRARGYLVVEAETVQAGEHEFRERLPDLAIVDQRLPDGNGLDLIKALRRIDERVPVLMVTGHASYDLAVQAMKVGAENFLTKPVYPPALLAV